MGEPTVTMDVRQAGGSVAVVDIKGEVTAACEPVLMSAWEKSHKQSADKLAMPLASGLIAGEAIMAIVIPVLIAMKLLSP